MVEAGANFQGARVRSHELSPSTAWREIWQRTSGAAFDLTAPFIFVLLVGVATLCVYQHRLTYAGGMLTVVLAACAGLWLVSRIYRGLLQRTAIAAVAEAFTLVLGLSLLAPLTAATLAPGSGPLIDGALARVDHALFPWFGWRGLIVYLDGRPGLMRALSTVYISIGWQPMLLILVAGLMNRPDVLARFVTVWALAVAICVLPFHWLAAMGPYSYYGIGPEVVPNSVVGLPFEFPKILAALRSGELSVISQASMTGLISFPSFHACAAVVLGWTSWSLRPLRWPLAALNAAMVASAVPIGGHYIVDVIAGCVAGLAAICATQVLIKWRDGSPDSIAPLTPRAVRPPAA